MPEEAGVLLGVLCFGFIVAFMFFMLWVVGSTPGWIRGYRRQRRGSRISRIFLGKIMENERFESQVKELNATCLEIIVLTGDSSWIVSGGYLVTKTDILSIYGKRKLVRRKCMFRWGRNCGIIRFNDNIILNIPDILSDMNLRLAEIEAKIQGRIEYIDAIVGLQ